MRPYYDEAVMNAADKTETILVVDDEVQIRTILTAILVKRGYKVIQAVDGLDALEKFKNNVEEIALLITDIIMPRMDGISSYKIISTINPSLKALFITGCTSDEPLPAGATVLTKPFSPLDIIKAVDSILSD